MQKCLFFALTVVCCMSVFAEPTLGSKGDAKAKPAVQKAVDAADKAKPAAKQCKGTTLEGARCKRSALEGKEFCAQHADQAVKTPCKALTQEDKPCSRMAAPRSFFCAQHEAHKKLADPKAEIGHCRALTDEGKQCSRKAAVGWRYCDQHRK